MRIAVLIGIDPNGKHETLKIGDPKAVKTFAKQLTVKNDTGFEVVRMFEQHLKDFRVHRGMVEPSFNEAKSEAPKGRGRPKKV
jgi:hypothetical protein